MKRAAYSQLAFDDLDDIWMYIATDSETAADRWIAHLRSEADRLADGQPLLNGSRRDFIADPTILFWGVGDYVIAYRLHAGRVEVTRVLHSARNLARINDWPEP